MFMMLLKNGKEMFFVKRVVLKIYFKISSFIQKLKRGKGTAVVIKAFLR